MVFSETNWNKRKSVGLSLNFLGILVQVWMVWLISLMSGQRGEHHCWKISDATVKLYHSFIDMELILTDLYLSLSFLDKQVKEIQGDLEKLSPHTIKHTKKVRCNYPSGCKWLIERVFWIIEFDCLGCSWALCGKEISFVFYTFPLTLQEVWLTWPDAAFAASLFSSAVICSKWEAGGWSSVFMWLLIPSSFQFLFARN